MFKRLICLSVIFILLPSAALLIADNKEGSSNPFSDIDSLKGREKLEKIIEISRSNYKNYLKDTLLYNQVGMDIAISLKDTVSQARLLSVKALMMYHLGEFDNALKFNMEELDLLSPDGSQEDVAKAYNRIGLIYWKTKDPQNALKFYNMSLDLMTEIDNKNGIAKALNNIGIIHCQQGDFDTCRKYMEQSLAIKEDLNDIPSILTSYNNLGMLYKDSQQYEKSESILNKGLKLAEKEHDTFFIIAITKTLGEMYLEKGDFTQSLKIHDSIMPELEKSAFNQFKMEAYYNYHLIYSNKKQTGLALDYYRKYVKIKDEIYTEKVRQKTEELKIHYETEKMLEEIDRLNKEKIKDKNIRNLTGIAMLLALFTLIITLIAYWNKKKSEKELKELVYIKNRIFSIIAHDLRGQLSPLLPYSEMLKSHFSDMDDAKKLQMINKINAHHETLFEFLENLLEWGTNQLNEKSCNPELIVLHDIVNKRKLSGLRAAEKNIQVDIDIPQDITVWGDKHMISTVILNLYSNAVKFTPKNGTINISAHSENKQTIIKVADTGIGIPKKYIKKLFTIETKYKREGTENEPGSGLGLIICNELVEKNNGTIDVESEEGKGTVFTVLFPSNAL